MSNGVGSCAIVIDRSFRICMTLDLEMTFRDLKKKFQNFKFFTPFLDVKGTFRSKKST